MAASTGENNNMAGVLAPENGQRSFDKVDLREEDGLELLADEILRYRIGRKLLYRANDSCLHSQLVQAH
jgi:hypothetical protein